MRRDPRPYRDRGAHGCPAVLASGCLSRYGSEAGYVSVWTFTWFQSMPPQSLSHPGRSWTEQTWAVPAQPCPHCRFVNKIMLFQASMLWGGLLDSHSNWKTSPPEFLKWSVETGFEHAAISVWLATLSAGVRAFVLNYSRFKASSSHSPPFQHALEQERKKLQLDKASKSVPTPDLPWEGCPLSHVSWWESSLVPVV